MYTHQQIGMYTGALNVQHSARIRFMNLKDYINTNGLIFNGQNMTNLPLSPTRNLVQFDSATNGMQFGFSDTSADGAEI